MQFRRLMFLAVFCLVIGLAVSSVYASYSTTFIYTKFNSTDTIAEELDAAYTDITATIYNKLMYNTTSSSEARIILANSTAAAKQGILVAMKKAGADNLLIYWKDGETDVELAKATWEADDIVEVQISSNVLTVSLYSNATDEWTPIIDNFHASSIEYTAICALGSNLYVATAGYISVAISEYGGDLAGTSGTINQWMPTIVGFAMLGIALSCIKKFG